MPAVIPTLVAGTVRWSEGALLAAQDAYKQASTYGSASELPGTLLQGAVLPLRKKLLAERIGESYSTLSVDAGGSVSVDRQLEPGDVVTSRWEWAISTGALSFSASFTPADGGAAVVLANTPSAEAHGFGTTADVVGRAGVLRLSWGTDGKSKQRGKVAVQYVIGSPVR